MMMSQQRTNHATLVVLSMRIQNDIRWTEHMFGESRDAAKKPSILKTGKKN